MKCHNYEVKTSQEIINKKDKHTSPRSLSRHTGKQSKVIIIIIIIISIRIINAKHNLKQHADTVKGRVLQFKVSNTMFFYQFNSKLFIFKAPFFCLDHFPFSVSCAFGHWLKFQI
jgi:hypothetical protein